VLESDFLLRHNRNIDGFHPRRLMPCTRAPPGYIAPGVTVRKALCDHHSVREALAFAVPSELGIDEVWALVVPASSLDEDALQRFCWEKLPHAQVPLRFITVADLPRTEIGKLDRHRLNAIVRGLRGSTG
jgi:acyl-coenzyme A synthetase/AMP-(fatty) acid ligase